VLHRFCKDIPKAELHLHIEGTLEPEMLWNLMKKNNVPLPYASVENIKEKYQFSDLQSFLDIYYAGAQVLKTADDFYDLTFAYFTKVHSQGVIHSEIFWDPQTHMANGISMEVQLEGLTRAFSDAEHKLGITSRLIMCFLRHLSQEEASECLSKARPWVEKGVIHAVGLDSTELGNPPSQFVQVFEEAGKLGLHRLAHAGEEGTPDYIWEAIRLLHIERIDHGNATVQDEELMNYVCENQIPLTMCPCSNLALKNCHSIKHHPSLILLRRGARVTINSDDPAYFGGLYIGDNFALLQQELGLTQDDIHTLAKNSLLASFMKKDELDKALRKLEEYVARFKQELP